MSGTQLELSELKRAWIDDVAEKIAALNGLKFSSDDIHKYAAQPDHPNWFGCLIAKLRCTGKIREIGRVKSARPERNGAKISLWIVT